MHLQNNQLSTNYQRDVLREKCGNRNRLWMGPHIGVDRQRLQEANKIIATELKGTMFIEPEENMITVIQQIGNLNKK